MTALSDFQMSDTVIIEQRSEPYYMQYHHCIIWWIPEGNMMRMLTHKAIDTNIHWRNNYLSTWRSNKVQTLVTEHENVIKYVQQEFNPITKKLQNSFD